MHYFLIRFDKPLYISPIDAFNTKTGIPKYRVNLKTGIAHGEPTAYNYKTVKATYPAYDLNPEIIESAYYLYYITSDSSFYKMNEQYWPDIKKYCRTDIAYTSIKNAETMEKKDYMPTFFFAETLKYLYLTFTSHNTEYQFNDYTFNTEAHPFKRSNFDKVKAKVYLGFE